MQEAAVGLMVVLVAQLAEVEQAVVRRVQMVQVGLPIAARVVEA
jgi:hypothetical protein